MHSEGRARARADQDDEEGASEAPAEETSVAFALARAVEDADAVQVLALLDAHVRAIDGAAIGDDGVAIDALERVSAAGGYRETATLPLRRALGQRRTARVIVDLLVRAGHRRREEPVTRTLAERLGMDRELFDAVHDDALSRAPEVLASLGRIAPDVVKITVSELRQLARADVEVMIRALPRLALGLPPLDGKARRAAEQILHALAPRHEPGVPAVIAVLLRAGVPHDRLVDGVAAIELAMEGAALENVRVLEAGGARVGRTVGKKERRRRENERKEARRKEAQRQEQARREGLSQASRAADAQRGHKGRPSRAVERARERAAKEANARGLTKHAMPVILGLTAVGVVAAGLVVWQPWILAPIAGLVLAFVALAGRAFRGSRPFRR